MSYIQSSIALPRQAEAQEEVALPENVPQSTLGANVVIYFSISLTGSTSGLELPSSITHIIFKKIYAYGILRGQRTV
jgi:hypothetical protein